MNYVDAMLLVAHRTPPTAAACAALAASGVQVFEVDVQLGGDGIVVSHFLPLFGVRGWIEHDNARMRWRSRDDPTLDEVAARVPAQCRILLDPKETAARRRVELLERIVALPDRERFVTSTTHPGDLAALRGAGMHTWRTIKSVRDFDVACRDGAVGDDAASVRHTVLTAQRMHALKQVVPSVVAWTVNSARTAVRLQALGVDGITSDRPAELTRILR
jgi:glycerophosphoryl diester phosphodiesterase